jgi:hypothetical protein
MNLKPLELFVKLFKVLSCAHYMHLLHFVKVFFTLFVDS